MGRFFADISQEELGEKIFKAFSTEELLDPYLIKEKLGKDLKVEFDFENFDAGGGTENDLLDLRTLPNGLTFWGMWANGDWERSVFFIIYWDGKKLRGYVPTAGNPWNRTTKKAYGNDHRADYKDARKHYPDLEWDEVTIEDFSSWFDPEMDWKLITKDIQERILPKETSRTKKRKAGVEVDSLEKRIKAITFYGTGDEGVELFDKACSFCYALYGLGWVKEAEVVYEWAESMAKGSKEDLEENPHWANDTQPGHWGY